MTAPTKAELARQIAKLERSYGITPRPGASLEQRAAAVAARQGSAKPAKPVTKAGRSNLSGDGERMDRLMNLPDRESPIVEQKGNTVVLRTIKPADARRQRAEQGIAPADDAFLAAFRSKYYGTGA